MEGKARLDFILILIFILLLVLFILLVEARRARVWLVDVEEEHKDRQEVVPERKKTAGVVVLVRVHLVCPDFLLLDVEGLAQGVSDLERLDEVLQLTVAGFTFCYQSLQHFLLVLDLFVQ